jgi:TRAP-type mannitol/chloroaromatic compound transport system permease small subunit
MIKLRKKSTLNVRLVNNDLMTSKIIDAVNSWIGKIVAWLTLVLVILICTDVALRYIFSFSQAGFYELEWHLFAAVFLLGAAYTLRYDKHVRVDVFYSRFSNKTKAWVNLIGTCLFLMPFCFVIVYTSIAFVGDSYAILESSPDPGGLPYRFIIKSTIPLGFGLLLLQGLSEILKSISVILKPTEQHA